MCFQMGHSEGCLCDNLGREKLVFHRDMIDDKYIKEVCKIGKGHDCCRYLICGGDGFECAKVIDELKLQLDVRVARGTINARGDNCEGIKNGKAI